jgi:hypothetical protein
VFEARGPDWVVRDGYAYAEKTFRGMSFRGYLDGTDPNHSQTPIIAVIVELIVRGDQPGRIADDLWLHTEIAFANDEQYPRFRCP